MTTFALSGGNGDSSNASSYATGGVTASEGDWIVLAVIFADATVGSVSSVSSASISSGNWSLVTSGQNPGTSPDVRIEVWKAKVPAGGISSEVITASMSEAESRAVLLPVVVSDADGTDVIEGSNFDSDSGDSTQALQCTLSAFQAGGSVLVFGCHHNTSGGLDFEASYTSPTEVGSGEALVGDVAWWADNADTTVDVDYATSPTSMVAVAMEVAAASGDPATSWVRVNKTSDISE